MNIFNVRETENSVYELLAKSPQKLNAQNELDVSTEGVKNLMPETWREISNFQGKFSASYLRFRYARSDARILIARRAGKIMHVQWVVPASHIGQRYSFVAPGRWAIISCLTAESCRGMGIYPAMLQAVMRSGISSSYLIWADNRNVASIRGIKAAGGRLFGTFKQKKYLKGVLSTVTFKSVVKDSD